MRVSRATALLALLVLPALLLAACGSDGASASGTEGDPQQMTFMAGFRPQANLPFVAVYVADAKGYFAEEGLEVDIQHSSGADEHLKFLLEGRVHVITGTAAQAIRRHADDLPVRAVALFGQRGDQGYVAHTADGIDGPEDFRGRSVGFKAGVVPAELHALLGTAGMTVNDVQLQSVGFDPRIFMEGGVEVYPVFLNNEPYLIRKEGFEISVIDPHEFGVPTLGLAFLVNSETLEDDPELMRRFLRAALRGAAYAAANIDEAVEITLEHAPGADAEHQRYLLETDLAAAARADGIGRADLEQWQALADLLLEHDVLDAPVDASGAWDGSIVDALYEGGEIAID